MGDNFRQLETVLIVYIKYKSHLNMLIDLYQKL